MNNKKGLLLAIGVVLLGIVITAGSYAFWSWQSNSNKSVAFNTSKALRNYIVYDEGESKFVGDFKVGSNYQDNSIHSTISLYKTEDAANLTLMATIHMDVNMIGENMKKSNALKWVVTKGNSTNPGEVLAQGNFVGTNNGDTLTLVPNIEVTTINTEYTVWIWLDRNANPSDALSGETLDTNVWTEINQLEGVEDRFEITRLSANYQNINATVVDSKAKVTHYAVVAKGATPSTWTSVGTATNIYNLNTTVDATGEYDVYFKDELGKTTHKTIKVTAIDNTAPNCTFGSWSVTPIANNETSDIELTCTDNESEITVNNLKTTDITKSNSNITITNINKTTVTNGYKYTITVKGTETDGTTTLTLPAAKVKNAMALGNAAVTSTSVTVANQYTVKYQTGNNNCTLSTTIYANKTATYGTAYTVANPTCTGYTFDGWTANSGLDTTNAKYGNSSSTVTTTWSNASTKVKATWFNNLALRTVKTVTLTANWTANDLTFNDQTLNTGTYGTAYTSNAFAGASNGTGSYTYAIKSGAPNGATLSSDRKISFTNTTPAGTYNVVVTVTDSISNKTKDATMKIVINPKAITITAKDQSITYGGSIATGTSQVTVATLASGDTLSAITLTPSTSSATTNGKITPSGATIKKGTTDVTSSYSITYVDGKLTIGAKQLTVPSSPADKTYTGSSQGSGITCPSGSTASGTQSATDAGTYTQTCTLSSTSNYVWSDGTTSAKNITWKIKPKSIAVTWGTVTWTYDGGAHSTTASAATGISAETMTLSISNNSITYKGTQAVSATCASVSGGQAKCANYTLTNTSKTLTINAKAITITAKDQSITYGGSIATGTGQVTVATLANGDTLSAITLTPSTSSATTNGKITPSGATIKKGTTDVTSSYSITYVDGKLIIGAKELTVPSSPADKTYTGSSQGSGITCPSGSTASGTQSATDAGTYTQTCTLSSTSNYVWSDGTTSAKNITWKINPKSIAVTWGTVTWTYDGGAHSTTASAATGISAETMTLSISNNSITYKGTQAVSATCGSVSGGQAKCANYTLTNTSKTLTINAKAITITAKDQSITYGESITTGTGQVTVATLASGDTLSAITLTPSTSSATTNGKITPSGATIKKGTTDITSSYSITYVDGKLTIGVRTVTITAPTMNSSTLTYNGSDQTISGSAGSCTTGGTMYYYTTNYTTASAPAFSTTSGWSTTFPTAKGKNATTYHLWYCCYVSDTTNNTGTGINTAKEVTKAIGKKGLAITAYSTAWVNNATTYSRNGYATGVGSETINLTYTPYTNAIGSYSYATSGASGKFTLSQTNSNYSISSAGNLTLTDSVSPTVQDIAGGTTLKATSQTLTLKCTDNIGVTAYYWGTTNPNTADKITTTTAADLTALQGSGLTKSVTAAGTYYLGCKDAAGNIASKSIVIRKYQVQNVLEKIAGTTETYTSENYENSGSAATYYVKDGTSLTLASIYSIPTGAAAGTFKGYTTSAPGTSTASPSTTAPTVATNDTTVYYMWFDRNTYKVTASKPTNGTVMIETVTQASNSVTASTAAAELTVKYGDMVKATATPSVGYSFTSWSGGYVSGTTNPSTGAAVTANKTITGTFIDITPPTGNITTSIGSNTVTATVTVSDTGSGPKSSYGWKVSTDSTCDSSTTGFVDSNSNTYNFNITSIGIHYICVRIEDNAGNNNYVSKVAETSYIDYEYTGDYQPFTVPVSGYYKLETWGAQGGTVSTGIGGKGGNSSGYIYLNEGEKLYIYVGEKVTSYADKISFNGGGRGSVATVSQGTMGANGGGATDIRYFGSETPSTDDLVWNSTKGLNSRIMVAAGGGGGTHWIDDTYASVGGSGGGLIGASGSQKTIGGSTNNSSGGTQTVGGTQANSSNNIAQLNGSFGQGGSSNTYTSDYVYQSGGGGGYYGGGAGNAASNVVGSASGGSSFISGYAGVNAITSSSNRTHTATVKHYSNKYFINGEMQAGVNSGNGKAKITYYGPNEPTRINENLNNVRYIKDCANGSSANVGNFWGEFQAIKNGVNLAKGKAVSGTSPQMNDSNWSYTYITDGLIDNITSGSGLGHASVYGYGCVTIDLGNTYDLDEIAVWHYFDDSRVFYDNVTYTSSDNSTWHEVIRNGDAETSNGKRVNAWNFNIQDVYTVTYHGNGGDGGEWGDTWSNTATYNQDYVTPKNWYTRTGYTFNGWNEKADGTGTAWTLTSAGVYENGNGANKWKWTYTNNIDLYAQWVPLTYTVTYSCGTGSGTAPSSQTVQYGNTIHIQNGAGNCSKTGHTFSNWTSPGYNGTGTANWNNWEGTWQYINGLYGISNNTLSLTASWTPITYTIQYSCGTGSGTAPSSQTVQYGNTIHIQNGAGNCSKTGHTFSNWTSPGYNGTGTANWNNWEGTWQYINGLYGISNNTLSLTASWTVTDTTKPTCTLQASSTAISFKSKTDNIGVTSFGLVKGTTKTYNNTSSLSISTGTFTGFVKDNAGNENTCTISIGNLTTTKYACCDSPGWYLINGDRECTFQMTQFAPASTCTKTSCDSGYTQVSGSSSYCYK